MPLIVGAILSLAGVAAEIQAFFVMVAVIVESAMNGAEGADFWKAGLMARFKIHGITA